MAYASSAWRTCGAIRSQSENTATLSSPISRQARAMRMAISPRLAIRTFCNCNYSIGLQAGVAEVNSNLSDRAPTSHLEWNVPVLLGRVAVAFAFEIPQGVNQFPACLARMDDLVEVPSR